MDRKQFLKNSLIIGGAAILPTNSLLAQNMSENGIDKLIEYRIQTVAKAKIEYVIIKIRIPTKGTFGRRR